MPLKVTVPGAFLQCSHFHDAHLQYNRLPTSDSSQTKSPADYFYHIYDSCGKYDSYTFVSPLSLLKQCSLMSLVRFVFNCFILSFETSSCSEAWAQVEFAGYIGIDWNWGDPPASAFWVMWLQVCTTTPVKIMNGIFSWFPSGGFLIGEEIKAPLAVRLHFDTC